MVAQERRPAFCRLGIARRFSHPAQHGSLGNIEAQHLQFTMNARRAPSGVLNHHADDQFAQLSADALSSDAIPMAREPFPVQLESCTVPANNSLWLDEDQRVLPPRPEPPQDYPEQLAERGDLCARIPLL